MEVLHLELLDSVAKHAIHLAHVDQLVVDFIDAAGAPTLSRSGITLLLL